MDSLLSEEESVPDASNRFRYHHRDQSRFFYVPEAPSRSASEQPLSSLTGQKQPDPPSRGPSMKVEVVRSGVPKVEPPLIKLSAPPRSDSVPTHLSESLIKVEHKEVKPIRLATSDGDDVETCPFCETYASHLHSVLKHIAQVHKFSDELLTIFKDLRTDFRCSKCAEGFTTESKLLNHCFSAHKIDVLRVFRDSNIDQWQSRRTSVIAFIEKHAPTLNPRFKRAYVVSSSSSESDDEVELVDQEYVTFVTNSIQTSGIAATSSAVKPQPRQDPAKTVAGVSSPRAPQTLAQYLEKIERYELFLRQSGLMICENGRFQCLVCKIKRIFDSSIRLIEHCYSQHRIRMTPELRRALCVLARDIKMDTPARDLLLRPDARLDLLLKCPNMKGREFPEPSRRLKVHALLADFLVEFLAVEPVCPFRAPKQFKQPTTVMLKLPVPLPVVFENFRDEAERGVTVLGFVNTAEVSHNEVFDQVSLFLTRFHAETVVIVMFKQVKLTGCTDEQLKEIESAVDAVILKSPDVLSQDEQTRDFALFIMSADWTQDATHRLGRQKLDQALTKLFEELELWRCRKCRTPYRGTQPCPEGGKHEPAKGLISTFQIREVGMETAFRDVYLKL
jgi:hypothetical protein